MSLKYGIYLVEQRIISPEQFCGLVKIQQESLMTLASISLRANALTIKQVKRILDIQEAHPGELFGDIALELNLIDRADLNRLLHEQQKTSPPIRQLVVECGLLTERQSKVLFMHFEKNVARQSVEAAPAAATKASQQAPSNTETGPRRPNFQSRPAVVGEAQSSSVPNAAR